MKHYVTLTPAAANGEPEFQGFWIGKYDPKEAQDEHETVEDREFVSEQMENEAVRYYTEVPEKEEETIKGGLPIDLFKDLSAPGQRMHSTVEGFMSGLKEHPKGAPSRGKFITAHMNHAPFISALQKHPQGKQIHSMLTSHLNGHANAGFRAGQTQAMAKALFLDLEKAERKKAYGHAAYERKTKSGKLVHVKQKGVKPSEIAKDDFNLAVKVFPRVPERLKSKDMDPREAGLYQALINAKPRTLADTFDAMSGWWDANADKEDPNFDIALFNVMIREWSRLGVFRVLEAASAPPLAASGFKMENATGFAGEKSMLRLSRAFNETKAIFDFAKANGGLTIALVKAFSGKSKNVTGQFRPSLDGKGQISVRADPDAKHWNSFAHEYGHFLDRKIGAKAARNGNNLLDRENVYASHQKDHPFSAFVEKLKNSKGYKYEVYSHEAIGKKEYAAYLQEPTEVLARFFNEWYHVRAHETLNIHTHYSFSSHAINTTQEWSSANNREEFDKLSREFESLLDNEGVKWRPQPATGNARKSFVLDLAKAKKPYGHTSYTRHTKSGKNVYVQSKGVKEAEPERIRWNKHVEKPGATFTVARDAEKKVQGPGYHKFFKLARKTNARTLKDAWDLYQKVGRDFGMEFTKTQWSADMHFLQTQGALTAIVPMVGKHVIPKNEVKVPQWKTLANPGVVLPPPYKPRGLKIAGKKASPIAEEMAWAFAPYLLANDPRRRPDKVMLENFVADFNARANTAISPARIEADFRDVLRAYQVEKAIPKEKKGKAQEKNSETHPHLYAKFDGKMQELLIKQPTMLKGRVFTGTNPKEGDPTGKLDLKNPHRGKWCPPISLGEVTLNGTSFPKNAKEYGATVTEPTSRWVYKIKVPRHVHKEGWLYAYKNETSTSKWDAVATLADKYQDVMDTARALAVSGSKSESELGVALVLIDAMKIRVGGKGSEDPTPAKGLTDLTLRNVWLKGNELHYRFGAKGGEIWDSKKMGTVRLSSPIRNSMARMGVGSSPGKDTPLFSHTEPEKVNAYLQTFDRHLTAHKFRHYHAMLEFEKQWKRIAMPELAKGIPGSKKAATSILNTVLRHVGKKLGHIISGPQKGAATARAYYVHPKLLRNAMNALTWDLRTTKERKNPLMHLEEGRIRKAIQVDGDWTPVVDLPVYETYYAADWVPEPEHDAALMEITDG